MVSLLSVGMGDKVRVYTLPGTRVAQLPFQW
jgi:hypothetical protein